MPRGLHLARIRHVTIVIASCAGQIRTGPARAPMIAPATKRLTASAANPPNMAARRLKSFPRTSIDMMRSLSLKMRERN
jgi:hypothetical protein